ncbi:MAG: peptidase C39 family protein, partial [Nocardioidaceae bacterium]|nr:peptidase C39 family protein [Nocardioidaceae bacterium]
MMLACATATAAAMTAVLPASTALAKKDTSVSHIRYEQWSSATDFAAGAHDGTTVAGDDLAIATPTGTFDYTDPYGDGTTTTYDVATWTSPEITPGFDYTELVASWNADTPAGTWIQVSVAGIGDDGARSKDYILARWAEDTDAIHRTSVPAQGDDLAFVAIDTLVARTDRHFTTWQLEVSLYRRTGTTATPAVSLIGAMASQLPEQSKALPASPLGEAGGITLDVPTYSQETHIGDYPEYNGGGEAWCSPTSTAMVMAYWQQRTGNNSYGPSAAELASIEPAGHPDPYVDYAAAQTYDWNYDGTGNWPFNTAYSGSYGLESFVTRLRSLTEAERFIKAGIPLVVSISFKKSELTGAGYGTNGHLMVIVGFTEEGDVVANDPASHLIRSNDEVRVVYDREEFENVWVPHSG